MNQRTFRLLERLDKQLWHLLCEVRFAGNLIDAESGRPLEIDSECFTEIMGQVARQLQAARRTTQHLYDRRR